MSRPPTPVSKTATICALITGFLVGLVMFSKHGEIPMEVRIVAVLATSGLSALMTRALLKQYQ